MQHHLTVAVQPLPSPGAVERQLIAYARPPLNLTHWANPYAARVKAARRACVNAAREAYPC
jgi:hypothetical protein